MVVTIKEKDTSPHMDKYIGQKGRIIGLNSYRAIVRFNDGEEYRFVLSNIKKESDCMFKIGDKVKPIGKDRLHVGGVMNSKIGKVGKVVSVDDDVIRVRFPDGYEFNYMIDNLEKFEFSEGDSVKIVDKDDMYVRTMSDWIGKTGTIQYYSEHGDFYAVVFKDGSGWSYRESSLQLVEDFKVGDWVRIIDKDDIFVSVMEDYLGEIGEITDVWDNSCRVKFEDENSWAYEYSSLEKLSSLDESLHKVRLVVGDYDKRLYEIGDMINNCEILDILEGREGNIVYRVEDEYDDIRYIDEDDIEDIEIGTRVRVDDLIGTVVNTIGEDYVVKFNEVVDCLLSRDKLEVVDFKVGDYVQINACKDRELWNSDGEMDWTLGQTGEIVGRICDNLLYVKLRNPNGEYEEWLYDDSEITKK